jgi:hypothetical protein
MPRSPKSGSTPQAPAHGLRVGTLCYATEQGLGLLARAFHDHGIVTDVMVIMHSSRPSLHAEWYPGSPVVEYRPLHPNSPIMREFLAPLDAMMFFETPFDWSLIDVCRSRGIKTALMVMYECTPKVLPYVPDLIVCPSHLDMLYYGDRKDSIHLPVPVDTSLVPWRQRERAHTFIHNAGHGGLKGRNGTLELIEAMRHVRSPLTLTIRMQSSKLCESLHLVPQDKRCQLRLKLGNLPYEELWQSGGEGDVFVFPEKFNGLSLPLQEARAAGMLVMGTDRYPMNQWLPRTWPEQQRDSTATKGTTGARGTRGTDPSQGSKGVRQVLIPPRGYTDDRIGPAYNRFEKADLDPRDIAAIMDSWYNQDIREYSLSGREWAESMSWQALGPRYSELIERLVET